MKRATIPLLAAAVLAIAGPARANLAPIGPTHADYLCGVINGTRYCSGDDGESSQRLSVAEAARHDCEQAQIWGGQADPNETVDQCVTRRLSGGAR
jgi:hypothetical protein